MSNQIDWSKAPEGATHYNSELPWPWLRDGDMPAYFVDGKWIAYESKSSGCARIKDAVRIPGNVEWDGVGLPPVGAVCEYYWSADDSWRAGTCVAHFDERAVICDADDEDCAERLDAHHVRPIRTPEQIAAEEREKAIEEMASIGAMADTPKSMAAKLYDAGYRKTEAAK